MAFPYPPKADRGVSLAANSTTNSSTQSSSDQKNDTENVSAETFSANSQETTPDAFPKKRTDALMFLAEQCLQPNENDVAPLDILTPLQRLSPALRRALTIRDHCSRVMK